MTSFRWTISQFWIVVFWAVIASATTVNVSNLPLPSGSFCGNMPAQSAGTSSAAQSPHSSTGTGALPASLGWYQVPNTKVRSLCPAYEEIQSVEGCSAVMADWSGGLFDTKRNRLIIWGGGHNGYYGNEIYAGADFSQNPITHALVRDASHGSAVSNAHTCPEAYVDGNPSSRHTYSGLVYLAKQDLYLAFGGSKSDCGNFSSSTWTFNPNNSSWSQDNTTGPADGYGSLPMVAYDSSTGFVFAEENQNPKFWKYDPAAHTWTFLANTPAICGSSYITAAIDPLRRLYFCIGGGAFSNVSLNSRYKAGNLNGKGCGPLVNAKAPGFAYDPVERKFIGWAGGSAYYAYDPDSDSCTANFSFSGGPTTIQGNGTYGRFQYSPPSGVFVVVNDVDSNVYTLRLTPPSGGSSTTGVSGVGTSFIIARP